MSSTTSTVSPGMAAVDESWIALTVVIVVLSLATLTVCFRIYTRIFLLKQLGWDDYCVILTLIIAVADGGAVLSTIPYGLGKHTATLDPTILVSYLRNFWLSIVLYNLTLAMIKLTFLFQYYRVLAIHKMKRVIYILGAIIMAWAISQLLITVFACTPVQRFWETDLAGTCTPNLPFWYINAAGNIASDLAIFIMPLPVLNRLQLRKKQKYFLIGIFSLGFFTCAMSLIRLSYLKQGPDFTFDNVPTSSWSISELASGIICACLPTLRPLMTKIKPQWMTSYATRNKRQTYGAASGHARYGAGSGSTENNTDVKSSTVHHTRTLPVDSSLMTLHQTLSSANLDKNYSRLDDDEDLEKAVRMPASATILPTHRKDDTSASDSGSVPFGSSSSGSSSSNATTSRRFPLLDGDVVKMQQLQPLPRSKQSRRASENEKAMEILGMRLSSGTGVSTQVVGGKMSTPSLISEDAAGGIEVKRDVFVTTTPTPNR